MRLLLVGAFPYPHDQGSQIYFQEQAIALRAAGAEMTLLTYGSGRDIPEGSLPEEGAAQTRIAEHWRALDGFDHRTSPRWSSPASLRSGPSWTKPMADLGLAMTLRNAVASKSGDDAYDAILTHNAEAAITALLTLPGSRPPIVYCVHTLLGQELSAYLRGPRNRGFPGSSSLFDKAGGFARGLDRIGDRLDRWIARRIDGSIALTHSAGRVMRQSSDAPGELIPPPVPDPEAGSERLDPFGTARRHSLEPGGFFLYSGNLDAYQELDLLEKAAAELGIGSERGACGARKDSLGDRVGRPTLVIATHHRSGRAWTPAPSMPGIQVVVVDSAHEMQSLLAAARASLVMRRAEGGFPVKLVNSLAVGTPVIAFREREWGLEHERNALIASPEQPEKTLARSIDRLAQDDDLASHLSAGARALYLERHQPDRAASRTLDLLERVMSARKTGR